MNILIASDTHGQAGSLAEAICLSDADVLLFLGDGLRDLHVVDETRVTVRAVRGNCDWYTGEDVPDERLEILCGYRVLLMHGHRYGVKNGIEHALAAAAAQDADVLLYGHTHTPFEKYYPAGYVLQDGKELKKPLLVVCPGSLGWSPSGNSTFATLTLRENGVLAGFGQL